VSVRKVTVDELWKCLHELLQMVGRGEPQAWAELDLTMPQLQVLMLASAADRRGSPPTMSELSSRLKSSMPTITRIADRLVAKRLVRRHRPERDRRCVQLKITQAGRRVVDQLHAAQATTSRALFGRLDQPARALLLDALGALLQVARDAEVSGEELVG